ncbi:MAG: hypothetical protein U9Q88_05250 [Bacillota bacterium]|nr:hypothetical protein [Bacillota bacterium]
MSSIGNMLIINIMIFIGVIVAIYILFSKGMKRVKFTTSIKKNAYVLGGYSFILLVSMFIYFMIPDEKFMEVQRQRENQSGFLLFENLMNKEDVDEKYLASVDVYPLEDIELEIKNKAGFAEYSVLFQKTEELQEEIEIQIYKGQFELNEYDFSQELPLPVINYTSNIIEVENAPYFEKNLAFFTPEFPFTQFSEERWEVQGSGSAQSSPIIYIKIPKDVDVIWDQDKIFVDEV